MTQPIAARASNLILVLAGLAVALAACQPKSPSPPSTAAVGCSAEEMRTRQARTPACEAQFRDLLSKAEADRQRNAAISAAPPAPRRDHF